MSFYVKKFIGLILLLVCILAIHWIINIIRGFPESVVKTIVFDLAPLFFPFLIALTSGFIGYNLIKD